MMPVPLVLPLCGTDSPAAAPGAAPTAAVRASSCTDWHLGDSGPATLVDPAASPPAAAALSCLPRPAPPAPLSARLPTAAAPASLRLPPPFRLPLRLMPPPDIPPSLRMPCLSLSSSLLLINATARSMHLASQRAQSPMALLTRVLKAGTPMKRAPTSLTTSPFSSSSHTWACSMLSVSSTWARWLMSGASGPSTSCREVLPRTWMVCPTAYRHQASCSTATSASSTRRVSSVAARARHTAAACTQGLMPSSSSAKSKV
mmetsp:Transcript_34516/g.76691  ORF Transcript_34516/g.76691 Transcript_34516/m.76691 type:complete len:259 (+) Transcript_34516:1347-2123(+)